ncbi:MAG: hypothetical protein DRO15_01325 [Thermoprotei archaeon]|nr:MAG: hypothetical protein DRO15_01325 [Thermoprotei archaeon]
MSSIEVNLGSRPVKKGDVLGVEGEDYIIAIGEELYALSPAAFYIWRMCDGRSISELVDRASSELGIPKDQLKEVFVNIVTRLAEYGLVELGTISKEK